MYRSVPCVGQKKGRGAPSSFSSKSPATMASRFQHASSLSKNPSRVIATPQHLTSMLADINKRFTENPCLTMKARDPPEISGKVVGSPFSTHNMEHVYLVKTMECLKQFETQRDHVAKYLQGAFRHLPQTCAWIPELMFPLEIPQTKIAQFHQQVQMWHDIHGKDQTLLETLFDIQKVTPMHDRLFSYFVASIFPFDTSGSSSSNFQACRLHGEISDILLSLNKHNQAYTLADFQSDMLHWKDKKLMFPLLLTSRQLDGSCTLSSDWAMTPEESDLAKTMFLHLKKAVQWSDVEAALTPLLHHPISFLASHLEFIQLALHHYTTPSLHESADLSSSPAFLHSTPFDTSVDVAESISKCFKYLQSPPTPTSGVPYFLLCPVVLNYRGSGTFGYLELKLSLDSSTMELAVLPSPTPQLTLVRSSILPNREPPIRLPFGTTKILALGETLLSPPMARLMQSSSDIARLFKIHVNTSDTSQKFDNIVDNLLWLYNNQTNHKELKSCIQQTMQAYQRFIAVNTSSESLPEPITISAWKLELPAKILTTVFHPAQLENHDYSQPHLLSRRVSPDKTSYKPIHSILVSNHPSVNSKQGRDVVGDSIRYRFRAGVDPILETTSCTNTLLAEAAACFAFHPPLLHNEVPLHFKMEWDQVYEDKRYSETQLANKSSYRYRDWCNFMAKDLKIPHKAKIDSHVLRAQVLHNTLMPFLFRDACYMFHVTSSLPVSSTIISTQIPDVSFEISGGLIDAFASVLKCKFKNSPLCLPVRDPLTQQVDKNNIHFYKDPLTSSILMVYSSLQDPEKNLEFMLFQLPAGH